MKTKSLNSEEKRFFRTVYHAAFANPFGELREKLDRKIAGLFPDVPRRESADRCIQEVDARIRQLERDGRATVAAFHGRDREIIQVVFLFDIFHKFRDRFDRLIMEQLKSGEVSVPVSFAEEAMAILHRRGIPESLFLHYFSFSYQLRRAFFFISKFLVGASPCMKELKRHLWNNVFTNDIQLYDKVLWNRMEDFSTLIVGETGTGKGTAAMAIGRSGYIPFDEKKGCFKESFTKAFIPINLSQFPETLLESELFGHKKGAFTGAVEDHKGVFEHCSSHGSIFLDEIGEVPGHVQIKLLHVLQERIFTPVGSHAQSRFRGRIIAATNRPMKDIVAGNVFRDDFYYRLCSDMFEVPPLRLRIQQNPQELMDLLSFTVERILGRRSDALVEKLLRIIDRQPGKDYHWPGNVRELEQCVKRIILRRSYEGHPRLKQVDATGYLNASQPEGRSNGASFIGEHSGDANVNHAGQIRHGHDRALEGDRDHAGAGDHGRDGHSENGSCREHDQEDYKQLQPFERWVHDIETGALNTAELLSGYCRYLYEVHGTYEAVARKTGLDRRTVKKYINKEEKKKCSTSYPVS